MNIGSTALWILPYVSPRLPPLQLNVTGILTALVVIGALFKTVGAVAKYIKKEYDEATYVIVTTALSLYALRWPSLYDLDSSLFD